jgi:hypothetical protein
MPKISGKTRGAGGALHHPEAEVAEKVGDPVRKTVQSGQAKKLAGNAGRD